MGRYTVVFCIVLVISGFIFGCTSESKSLKLSPEKIDFQSVNIGDSATLELLLTNKIGKEIVIHTLDLSGSSDYLILSGGTLPINMEKNAQHTIEISFAPLTSGTLDALLTITHDASTKSKSVEITGIGVAVPRISLSENSYDFKKCLINKSHTHDFEIENTGTADLVINSLSLSGSNMADFKVTTAPLTIVPGSKEVITLTFEPTIVANYVADLSIVHNAVNEPTTITFPIIGEGIDLDPQITLNQTSPWDFGTIPTGTYKIIDCEVENTGIDPLTVGSCTLSTGVEFTIDSVVDMTAANVNFPAIIQVGKKIFVSIKFEPSSDITFNDTLSIEHDGTNEATPLDVSLTGSGKTAVTKTFNYVGTVESWTVPAGVTMIRIECWGAEGGENIALNNCAGKGARMRGDFVVSPGETLSIVVGQRGYDATSGNTANGAGGGGGGSFVWRKSNDTYPMIGAGAGGASCLTNNGQPHYLGKDGVTTEAATGSRSHDQFSDSPGGTGGNDGKTITKSGGKGWISIKVDPSGGTGAYYGGNGGYGGGGANGLIGGDPSFWNHNAGGGGGYSGGGAGGTRFYFGGGGGGSYNSGSSPDNASGVQQGNGKIVITY